MARKSKFMIPEEEYVIDRAPVSENTLTGISLARGTSSLINIACDKLLLDNENSFIYGNETEDTLKDLSEDIKTNGFKGAIMAYPVNGRYQIESGHRRFLAAMQAGLTEIPVIITKAPKTDAERRIRLISMNLHVRDNMKPTITATVIETLLQANKEDRENNNMSTDMMTLMDVVSGQMELSVKSIEKYRQFSKLDKELKELADEGISWSALTQGATLSTEKQKSIAASVWNEIGRVGVDNVSREWILSLIKRLKREDEPVEKPKTVVKRRDGGKIIAKAAKEFEDIMNGNVIFKKSDREETLKNLNKIKECIEKQISELKTN